MVNRRLFMERLESGAYSDPSFFIRENTSFTPLVWQNEAFVGLFSQEKGEWYVRQERGDGVSTLLAMGAFYFFMTRIPSKIIIISPTISQSQWIIFQYVKSMFEAHFVSSEVKIERNRIFSREIEYDWHVAAISPSSPKLLGGYFGPDDGKGLLWIVDSADRVRSDAIEVMRSSLVHKGNYLLMGSTGDRD